MRIPWEVVTSQLDHKQLWENHTGVGGLMCPEGRVSSLNKSNPITSNQFLGVYPSFNSKRNGASMIYVISTCTQVRFGTGSYATWLESPDTITYGGRLFLRMLCIFDLSVTLSPPVVSILPHTYPCSAPRSVDTSPWYRPGDSFHLQQRNDLVLTFTIGCQVQVFVRHRHVITRFDWIG